ncbi:hypothetical protein B0T26DRAFT_677595 [Lasiosphaeria miniovina]|uniref:Uncharacterized protein n=1 Tax=Lasiosphaeria miniovina TaxID=1954250 RepID=A0AA40AC88_9PEZI|nr:uncharacterized protein B0T26DRAFT_677595 [Lasiosphaeria miniovina]KAK0713235.1 hypothetical protein B0T26DRAFT_677595 [Lasiosphaeria miniovina]
MSLEYRPRDVPEVFREVLSLLDELSEAVGDGNESDFEDDDREDLGAVTDEAPDILDIASDCVGNLFRISMLIRKATPRDRFAKTLQDRRHPFMDQFDINYVQERYPRLAHPGKRWLLERLGRAITNRRQYLRYCREHKERLEQPCIERSSASANVAPVAELLNNLSDPNRVGPHAARQENFESVEQPSTNLPNKAPQSLWAEPSTKASTLDNTRLKVIMGQPDDYNGDEDEDDGRTYSSAASSVCLEEDGAPLLLPSLGDVSQGSPEFECILCRGIKRFTREKTWRRLAYRDLKTCVCTLGDGECSLEMFSDQKTWFEHEMERHRGAHIATRHAELDSAQVSALISVSNSMPNAIPAQDCPFCGEWEQKLRQTLSGNGSSRSGDNSDEVVTVDPQQFRRHVGEHLRQLSLFAIPRAPEGSGKGGSFSVGGRARSSCNNPSQMWSSNGKLSFRTVSVPSVEIEMPLGPETRESEGIESGEANQKKATRRKESQRKAGQMVAGSNKGQTKDETQKKNQKMIIISKAGKIRSIDHTMQEVRDKNRRNNASLKFMQFEYWLRNDHRIPTGEKKCSHA